MQRLHAQNHSRQRAAQNLGVGKALTTCKVLRVIQADANAISHTAATPGALVGSGLADRLDHQLLDFAPEAVALDARCACVDHIPDARYRQRRFSHIGGQHDTAVVVIGKNLVLLGRAQACKQRQYISAPIQRLVCQMLAQVIRRFADFTFTRQKNQNVTCVVRTEPQLVHRISNRIVQVIVA